MFNTLIFLNYKYIKNNCQSIFIEYNLMIEFNSLYIWKEIFLY